MAFIRRFREKKGKEEKVLEARRIADFCRSELRWADEGTTQQTFLISNVLPITRASLHCLVCQLQFAESANRLSFLLWASPKLLCHHKHLILPKEHEKKSFKMREKHDNLLSNVHFLLSSLPSILPWAKLKIHSTFCEIKIP